MEEKRTKILVAVDGSDNSLRAVEKAKEYAEIFNGEIALITVLKPLVVGNYGYINPTELDDPTTFRQSGNAILEKAIEIFGDNRDQISRKISVGDPANEILREAKKGHYDLIIMGSRGLGLFSRSFLGSVSNKVLNHADNNVLIVK